MLFLAVFRTCSTGLVVGRVRRQEDRGDALQQPARLVEGGQRFHVVEPGVVQDDRDLLCLGFSLEQVRCEDRLLGVLVPLDRVQFDFFAGRGEGAEEGLGRPPPVHGQFGALSFRGLHAAGLGLVLQADLVRRADLPAGVQQGLDLCFHLGHAPGDGFLVAVPVERVRAARDSTRTSAGAAGGRSPTGVVPRRTGSSRRHVPPGRPRTRRGHPSGTVAGRGWLEFFLPGAGGFRRVLVPGVPGEHRAHPGGPPLGQPLLHGPLRPLDHFSDDAHVDATGGVQNRFCLHPNQHMIVGTPPPPDQDDGLLRGDPDLHAPIISETAQEIHEKHGFVSCRPKFPYRLTQKPC